MTEKTRHMMFPGHSAWAIEPATYQQALHALNAAPEAAFGMGRGITEPRTPPPLYEVDAGIAMIRFEGVVTKQPSLWARFFGESEACTTRTCDAIRQAVSDPAVSQILLRVDSPGGVVDGVFELADCIFKMRDVKPITAYADDNCMSGAYFIASQASRIFAGASSRIGSLGCFVAMRDFSRLYGNEGVEVSVVKAGAKKGLGLAGTVITEEVLAEAQRTIDETYATLLTLTMRGRNMNEARAREVSDGRVHVGAAAIPFGLVDGITNLASLIGQLKEETPPPALPPNTSPVPIVIPMPGREGIINNRNGASRTEAQKKGDAMEGKELAELVTASVAAGIKPLETRFESLAADVADLKTKAATSEKKLAEVAASEELTKLIASGKQPDDKGRIRLSPDRESVVRAAFTGGGIDAAKKVVEAFAFDVPGGGSIVGPTGAAASGFADVDAYDPKQSEALATAARALAKEKGISVLDAARQLRRPAKAA